MSYLGAAVNISTLDLYWMLSIIIISFADIIIAFYL